MTYKNEAQKVSNAKVEALALKLYDELNPEPFDKINVSKATCISVARKCLAASSPITKREANET